MNAVDPAAAFIEAASIPLDSGHNSGTLERAQSILAAHPEVANSSIHAAAILGDDETVHHFLEQDPGAAIRGQPPRKVARTVGIRSRISASRSICVSTEAGPAVSSEQRRRCSIPARTRTPDGTRRITSPALNGRARSMALRESRTMPI